jgi:hypothetical protein
LLLSACAARADGIDTAGLVNVVRDGLLLPVLSALIEAAVIVAIFRTGWRPTLKWMLIANFASNNYLVHFLGQNVLLVKRAGRLQYMVSLQAKFIGWPIDELNLLPCDQLVFQMGNQILLLDMPTRRIGVIKPGTHPFVVLTPGPRRQGGAGRSPCGVFQ